MADKAVRFVASQKVTVVLFAFAIFLVFAGTMAQTQMDIWEVVNTYFRSPIAKIDLQVFFPPSFFPSKPQVPGWFPFPGGWTIGILLLVNLGAAAALRFPVRAEGKRLWGGLGVTVLGVVAIWAVVASGSNKQDLHYAFWLDWSLVWQFFLWSMILAWFGCVAALLAPLVRGRAQQRGIFWMLLAGLGALAVAGAALGWLVVRGDEVRLDDSNMVDDRCGYWRRRCSQ